MQADAARAFQRYAKTFHAGAFATPTAREIAAGDLRSWPEVGMVAMHRRLRQASRRTDWTGRTFELPVGTSVLTHVARPLDAPVPDLAEFDVVRAYREDAGLTEALIAQGRSVLATQISAASEILATWCVGDGITEAPVDLVTVARFGLDFDLAAARSEVVALDGWHDDYPFYSDGSWSALSLRGFRADDPTWGVKPAEMNRDWQAKHPGALDYSCGWTILAQRCPTLAGIVTGVPWWGDVERVRLLRMSGTGHGVLRRHTDITDRGAGTAVGQVARFHVPIVTDPAVTMTTWALDGTEETLHLAPGSAWYLDARKPHAVANPTDIDRVHLVVDVIVTSEVREMLCG